MSKLQGKILTLPKMSGSVSAPSQLSGNVGSKTINIGGKGDDGATFIPSVSADGVISWTNDKELPNPQPVNIKGAQGQKGADGKTPVKGVDYFTEADKKEIAEKAAELVEVPEGGGVTSWNDLTDKPFGETPPAFDISWDGDMTGHETFQTDENKFFVKVSDGVFTKEQLLNSTMYYSDGYDYTFTEEDIYVKNDAGVIDLGDAFVVFSAEAFIGAMGFPEGSVSNGVWFVNWTGEEPYYFERLIASSTIKTLDNKYLDLEDYVKTDDLENFAKGYAKTEDLEGYAKTEDLATVATSGSWNDLKDRPFYDNNYEDVVYLKEGSTISIGQFGISLDRSLTVSATYKIELEGKSPMLPVPISYSTTATAVTSNTFDNFSASGWSSYVMAENVTNITFPFNTALVSLTNCTIRIAEMVTEVKPLDEKYLPDSVVLEDELTAKGYQTEAQVTKLINNALGVIENGSY